MFAITEISTNGRRTELATSVSFVAARDYVLSLGVAHIENDADYVGCADALTNDGRVIAIQPVGFKLS